VIYGDWPGSAVKKSYRFKRIMTPKPGHGFLDVIPQLELVTG
jgi:hypothetical protein